MLNDTLTQANNHSQLANTGQVFRSDVARVETWLHNNSSVRAVRMCRRSVLRSSSHVSLALKCVAGEKRKASFGGLMTCKNKACVSCSLITQYRNQHEVLLTLEAHLAKGGAVLFGTMTATSPHIFTPDFYSQEAVFEKSSVFQKFVASNDDRAFTRAQRSEYGRKFRGWVEQHPRLNSWDKWKATGQFAAVKNTMRNVLGNNRQYRSDKDEFGIEGFVWVWENRIQPVETKTLSPSGVYQTERDYKKVKHNFHTHYLLFLEAKPSPVDIARLQARLVERWKAGMRKHGYRASSRYQELRWFAANSPDGVAKLARYLTKTSYEVAAPVQAVKQHDDGSVSYSPFQALQDAARGNESASVFWRNWEGLVRGARLINWSGIRAVYGVQDVVREERIERSLSLRVEEIARIQPKAWKLLVASGENRILLLNIAENSPTPRFDAALFLTQEGFVEGVDFVMTPEPEPVEHSPLSAELEQLYQQVALPF